ncbi:hypothetical protein DPMN_134423 [Dreissena polymorpha]|uniref:Lipid-binding serum glycoprotein N-terminal domain-containing protein n=1 Tax=Dreissena polymorpha TaxID=45954 RepID=A0A9D4FVJ6_DREPO|nr:hypothetical protein DPMN_134423 [Dreissena polymorpha]
MELQRLQTLLTTVKLDDAYDDGGDFSWRISGLLLEDLRLDDAYDDGFPTVKLDDAYDDGGDFSWRISGKDLRDLRLDDAYDDGEDFSWRISGLLLEDLRLDDAYDDGGDFSWRISGLLLEDLRLDDAYDDGGDFSWRISGLLLEDLRVGFPTVKLDDAYDDGRDFSWRISGIQISSAGTLSSSVQLRTGSFSWSLQISSLEINANWKMKYDPGRWLPTVRDSGRLSTSVRQSGITLTVQPVVETESLQVNLQDCSASLSGLEVSFGGSILSRFYELVANAFEGDIRRQLERAASLLL